MGEANAGIEWVKYDYVLCCETKEEAKRERAKLYRRAHMEKKLSARLYNLTLDEYNKLFINQSGICAICGNELSDKRLIYVDHKHSGLLCQDCNFGLWWFKSNPRVVNYIFQ